VAGHSSVVSTEALAKFSFGPEIEEKMSDSRDASQDGGLGGKITDTAIRLGLLGLIIYWCFWILGPFIVIIVWGGILTVALCPAHLWLVRKFGNGTFASAIIVCGLLVAVIGPALGLGVEMVRNVEVLAADLVDGTIAIPPPPSGIAEWPIIGEHLASFWTTASNNLASALAQVSSQLKSIGRAFLGFTAMVGTGLLQFVVAIFIAGGLFGRARSVQEGFTAFARRAVGERGPEFVTLSAVTIRNVAVGVIGIAVVQATLAGIGLLFAGIPAAGLLTFLVLVLSAVQVGPGIVLIPTIIYAWLTLDTTTALLFTIWMAPVSLIDNVLKPIVMARGLATPMLVIFIGVIGGTLAHGLVGLFIGPVILALGYELTLAWVRGSPPGQDGGERSSVPDMKAGAE
jgi:predicted PurR-regulated permease PerM